LQKNPKQYLAVKKEEKKWKIQKHVLSTNQKMKEEEEGEVEK
jgi:hypothetical protein